MLPLLSSPLAYFQGYSVLVAGLYSLYQGTRHKAWAKRQRADNQAV